MEVGENIPRIYVWISSHLEGFRGASALTDRSILKQPQSRVNIHDVQCGNVGRAHDPLIVLDGVPLRHFNNCQLEGGQVDL